MPPIEFLKHLNRKLKTGNLRSIHLNSLPGRYATRLDLSKLDILSEHLSNSFLKTLLHEPKFEFTISFDRINLNEIDDNEQNELNFIAKKLNGMYYQNTDNYLEHGIKTFGFGYPILIKRNKQDPSKLIKAPLIIWNLDIEKSFRKTNEWIISRSDDYSISINEVLISHMEQDEKITIKKLSSEYLEDGIIDQSEIVEICSDVLDQLNSNTKKPDLDNHISSCPSREKCENITGNIPWISWSGVFGLYRAQKESIITELDKLIDKFDSLKFEKLEIESYQTSSITGVETDPSQEEIINSLSKNIARIIQGPPGTGKSQSLTAIITNALENKAKCLVVCEKKTALDVIYNNLNEIGLGKLCAVIDDVSRDRKKLIKKVRTKIDEFKDHSPTFRENAYSSAFGTYNQFRKEINKKHKSVLKKIFGDDKWKDIIGKYISKEKVESKEILKSRLNKDDYLFTFDEFQDLSKFVKNGKILFNEVNTLNHPLEKLSDGIFKGHYLHTKKMNVENFLKLMSNELEKFISSFENNINRFGNRFNNNSQINIIWTEFLSIFSKRFEKIKRARTNFLINYHKFWSLHEEHNCFSFDFIQTKGIKYFSDISPTLESYKEINNKLLEQFNAFREFFEWKSFFLSMPKNKKSLITALIKSEVKDWDCALESWYYDNILSKYESELSPFHQNSRQINELSRLGIKLTNMQQNKIVDLWTYKQQRYINKFKSKSGSINSLYNYKKNKQYGRKNSLRKIIHTDFDLFTSFFPVVMINPVAASSILPIKEGLFDVVIFDEASQLRLEDTFTSYIRGKYKIISGDVHQMPPSNYFGKEIVLDYDDVDKDSDETENKWIEDPLDMADKESLLHYAVDSGFEKSYLDFHYRSRHPYLIDFSNAAFYGLRLTPMPEKYTYKPIRFIEVRGLYEKNRTNPDEAKTVIDILFNHINKKENGEYPSIGIATFNIDQRNLILEMIQDECYLDEEKNIQREKLLECGLFVKNLENIQGDERDVIIISSTFGLNSQGKFRQNFGPINQQKGYKLLNVIITRAKHRLYMCTSIPPEYYTKYQGKITANGNLGIGIFYAYLAYTKSVEDSDSKTRQNILNLLSENCSESKLSTTIDTVESPFEQEVYDYLSDYIDKSRIVSQYKFGGFRIDFVIRSKINKKPIIAIECDGAHYHSTEEAYAHDIYRQKLIEKELGLKFYRIWSTNWWIDPQLEVKKLVDFIESIDLKDEKIVEEGTKQTITERLKFTDEAFTAISIQKPEKEKTDQKIKKQVVTLNSTVTIKYLRDGEIMTVSFTKDKNKVNLKSLEKSIVFEQSPLARSLLSKSVGDRVKINGIEVYCEILDINNK